MSPARASGVPVSVSAYAWPVRPSSVMECDRAYSDHWDAAAARSTHPAAAVRLSVSADADGVGVAAIYLCRACADGLGLEAVR